MKNSRANPIKKVSKTILMNIYSELSKLYGEREWWLDVKEFEIILGAILVQNTSWSNAKQALENLKRHNLANAQTLYDTDNSKIRELIKPAGLLNIKLTRIKNFLDFFKNSYDFSINFMKNQDSVILREELIQIKGIGRETADVILLYALDKEVFCIDNYTIRIFSRLGFVEENIKYEDLKNIFENVLDSDIYLYRKYHIFLDAFGHYICKKKPYCDLCPLNNICEYN